MGTKRHVVTTRVIESDAWYPPVTVVTIREERSSPARLQTLGKVAGGSKAGAIWTKMPFMIDRDARNRAVALVESYWAGTTTNRQLEAAWPDSYDRGVIAVEDFVCTHYDEFKEHAADETDRANPDLNLFFANCVRFLRSDERYNWPHYSLPSFGARYPRWAVWATLGLLDLWNKAAAVREEAYWREMHEYGDVDAWPFRQQQIS